MGVWLERVGICHRRDVDGEPWVTIDVPRAAEVIFAVEDQEVVDTEALHPDGGAHPAEAGADDDRPTFGVEPREGGLGLAGAGRG